MTLVQVSFRIFLSGQVRRFRPRKYTGSPEVICRKIVEACFDSKRNYFRTSVDTYPELWSRDFGRCVPALIHTGYRQEVISSYCFAFNAYEKAGRYELTILPNGRLYNFPFGTYSPDGFAFFLYGLCALDLPELVDEHRPFLQREAVRFFNTVIHPQNGTVKTQVHFSEAQDYLRRDSSCYATCCCYIVQQALNKLGIDNPLTGYDYPAILKQRYYSDDLGFFFDDVHQRHFVSGDANILPFWTGAVRPPAFEMPKDTLDKVLNHLDAAMLNTPLSSRYRNGTEKLPSLRLDRINPWQTDSVWTCLGIHFMEMLALYAPHRFIEEKEKYLALVNEMRCFPEVISSHTGDLYRYPLYVAETSMLWAANLLNLLQDDPRVTHEHL